MATIENVASHILDLEKGALERWCNGDPSGFLEICSDDVVYFDPFLEQRIDGLAELSEYYEGIRGKVRARRFEILQPNVQVIGEAAILTFCFVSWGGNEDAFRWNCTEVYRREGDDWRIVQTHWSYTKGVRG
ncbi:MAG TPA: nuclear transport factor 2 family protein [Candidatus Binatia bacterium]|jgi:ketosteroid isomerase-like protein